MNIPEVATFNSYWQTRVKTLNFPGRDASAPLHGCAIVMYLEDTTRQQAAVMLLHQPNTDGHNEFFAVLRVVALSDNKPSDVSINYCKLWRVAEFARTTPSEAQRTAAVAFCRLALSTTALNELVTV